MKDLFQRVITGLLHQQNYWKNGKGEYQFDVTGIQECFSDILDSCWAGFDAMYLISVSSEQLDNFLNNFTEITKEEYNKKVSDLCVNMKKWIKKWNKEME